MLESALKVINKLEESGFKAYIVGGFVRDKIIGINSFDIDITTNATPQEIIHIFPDVIVPKEDYGALTIMANGFRFEIVTFRKDIKYYKNRKPMKVEYITSLIEDLKRRDFTMNTLCIDCNNNIIDLLDSKKDIDNRIIVTVGDPYKKLTDDPLRILRAIRFYTVLEFELDEKLKKAIVATKKGLKRLSYNRKKEELDLIFSSKFAKRGVAILKELGLDKELEIYNLEDIKLNTDLIGIWASLKISDNYPFTKSQKSLIKDINEVKDLNPLAYSTLYKYGLYVCSIVGDYQGLSRQEISQRERTMPISCRKDINIETQDILDLLNKKPGVFINTIINDITDKILSLDLINDKKTLSEYIIKNYGGNSEK